MSRIAAIIVNYNMPERTDALAEYIAENVRTPIDVLVVDNGSDLKAPSKYTALRLDENVQTTAGWLMGLHYADALARKRGEPYAAYWFIITSAEFVGGGDPLSPMIDLLESDPEIVGVHPILTEDSTTSWEHMKQAGRTWMIDNIASLYRADWFDSIGRFDPAMTFAWGIDLETCYKARQAGKKIVICDAVAVKKVTNIGYKMNRMNMTATDRERLAGENMASVLSASYGPDWWQKMTKEYLP